MYNRRYALLGWAVWQAGTFAAKRRLRSMTPSKRTGQTPPAAAAVVPLLVVAGGAAVWFLFFRKGNSGDPSEPVG